MSDSSIPASARKIPLRLSTPSAHPASRERSNGIANHQAYRDAVSTPSPPETLSSGGHVEKTSTNTDREFINKDEGNYLTDAVVCAGTLYSLTRMGRNALPQTATRLKKLSTYAIESVALPTLCTGLAIVLKPRGPKAERTLDLPVRLKQDHFDCSSAGSSQSRTPYSRDWYLGRKQPAFLLRLINVNLMGLTKRVVILPRRLNSRLIAVLPVNLVSQRLSSLHCDLEGSGDQRVDCLW